MMKYIDYFDGLILIRCVCVCVCVWCEVNRNRKWIFSCVMQRLVPTHTGGWGYWPSILRLINFIFAGCA